jgi:hypothetical protein
LWLKIISGLWLHWGCVDPQTLQQITASLGGHPNSWLAGYDNLTLADKARVDLAISTGQIEAQDAHVPVRTVPLTRRKFAKTKGERAKNAVLWAKLSAGLSEDEEDEV